MKKRILAIRALQIFMVLGSCSSDSSSPETTEPTPDGIKAEFIVSGAEDFVINNDEAFFIGQTPNDKDYPIKFQKADKKGYSTLLKGINDYDFLSNRLAINSAGNVLLISYNHQTGSDKIFRFDNNFTELNPLYTMKPISSPSASKIRLTSICYNNDNTYFLYDYSNKQMKRFLPELNSDVFVAGSGKNEIVDGTGLSAAFSNVSKIISLNNVLYFIDEIYDSSTATYKKSTIRKLEFINNQWTATTLIATTNGEQYTDIAFDSKNDLYVAIAGKGIYKLNLADNTLSLFQDKEEVKVWVKYVKDNVNSTIQDRIDFKHIKGFKFKNNDLYILNSNLIKISDFQSKIK